MHTSTNPDDFFESDSIRAAREYQRSRISYAKGSPFRLPGKILSIANHLSSHIGAGCSNGVAYIFQISKNRLLLRVTCKGHSGPVSAIQFFNKQHQLLVITGSWDRSIKIFDAWNGSLIKTFDQVLPDLIRSIALFPSENLVIVFGDARGSLCILDVLQNRKVIRKACNRSIEVIKVEGTQIFIASSEGAVCSFTIDAVDYSFSKNEGLFSNTDEQHATSIYSMDLVSPDTLYTGSADGCIFAWDVPSWVRSLVHPQRRRDLLFAGLADGTLHLIHDQEIKFTVSSGGHFDAITGSICITSENNIDYLITASLDGTVRTWIVPSEGKLRLEELPSASFDDDEDLDALLCDEKEDDGNG
ncbi:hypothetical protein DI09_29p70 [Mitosporidium daphniae]|uniref:Uncharacterized protein n=1 Tax=Mitosporidium daphniae TaxID=1485682 RepID=A0A098VVC1_9MICR|nr:uncharacterized protein DI09_29p70 [Mitosporidium daphniae]KGG51686.1 hypothetical protein DI09_29p70 [Mitosporidium daphniae]|eukprot:XP_013238144.1 uncharacterized protein DI09_29p70 [Mitosporidium daphniae]